MNNMKNMKWLLILVCCLCITVVVKAQQEEEGEKKGFDKSKLFVGGNFGMSFGDYTFINISPQVGYRFTNRFAAGVGINGQYTEIKSRINGTTIFKQSYGVAGMNVFGRFYPIRQVFVQAQPELNYVWGKTKDYRSGEEYTLNSKILPSLLIAGGGAIPMGRAGAFIIMVQYDVLHKDPTNYNPGTPYGDRIFYSFGFNVGL